MLLLAQHAHETIILDTRDGPIELRLHVIDGQQARIGIEAPPSVRIVRRSGTGPGTATPALSATDLVESTPWWQHPDD